MVERSPNFPQIPLAEAIDNVKLIYQREGRSKMPKLSAVKPLGYTSINGRSLGVLAALRAYGLLDGRGDDVRVSDDALTILNAPRNSVERDDALRRSFETPPAFALLRAKDGASADTLRWHLIKANFRDDAADKLIRVFLDSKTYIDAEGAASYPASDTQGDDDARSQDVAPGEENPRWESQGTAYSIAAQGHLAKSRPGTHHEALARSIPDFIVKLGDDLVAIIEIKGGEPSPRHLAKLARFINLQRQLLLDDDDDQAGNGGEDQEQPTN